MKHLRYYSIFESNLDYKDFVNQELITDIIDLSLEFLDDGYELSYFVKVGDHWLLTGGRRLIEENIPLDASPTLRDYLLRRSEINKDWQHWVNYNKNYKPESPMIIKKLLESEPLKYYFRIYSIGESGDERDQIVNKEAQSEVIHRIQGLYPDEIITTY